MINGSRSSRQPAGRQALCIVLCLLALALMSCARGGVYRGYSGPDRDQAEIAVLNWTDSDAWVTHIDDNYLHEHRFAGGPQISVAHLLPGEHTIRIAVSWSDLYHDGANPRHVDLLADFRPGHFYVVNEAPCKKCNPFTVAFSIVEADTADVLVERTVVGTGPYGEARKEEVRECLRECEIEDFPSCWSVELDSECEEEQEQCKDHCDPLGIQRWKDLFD